jgi:DNA-binding transcriptional LysR family regulator
MDIHQLELFLAVMESPSMTRAAEKVFLSPGAASLQLHNLADELHTELFVRSGKRLIPTPAAVRLAEHAKDLIKRMGQIKQEFQNDLATDIRPFHFATGVTTLIYQLGKPPAVAQAISESRDPRLRECYRGNHQGAARPPLRSGPHFAAGS